MEVVNLLKFLNNVSDLYALDYAGCGNELINLLDIMSNDEQFTHSIDLGVIYLNQKTIDKYIIVDGLNRFVSLTLLLHAICECYKKTTARNTKAIKTIRSKYIMKGSKLKLHLPENDAVIFSKIINGERLSGREKSKPMFQLLHKFWTQIKEEKIQAAHIFKMLQKVNITIVETDEVSKLDLYYCLNKDKRNINQILLIDSFLNEQGIYDKWKEIKSNYFVKNDDISAFLADFFITKFNYKKFNPEYLYESFVNYYKTMMQYISKDTLIGNINKYAKLYSNMLNNNFENNEISKAFINIRRHNGSDTYAYILNVYDDYVSGNISESIFIEILNTIDEYLVNRQNSGKNIDFNVLVQYLNTLISYK